MADRLRRSAAVPLGAVSVLAAALLAGCGDEEAVREATAYCVTEVPGATDFRVVDQEDCDGSDGSTWIVYSTSYPRAYRPGDRIPASVAGTKVRASDPAARAAHGFTRTGAIPSRGGGGSGG